MIKKINFWYQLFFIFIFLSYPINLFKKFFLSDPYVRFLLSDYLLIKFYLNDIFIALLLILVIFDLHFHKELFLTWEKLIKIIKNNKIIFFLLAVILIKQFFNSRPLISFFYFFCILKLIFLSLILNWKLKIIIFKNRLRPFFLFITILLFLALTFLGLYQFTYQKSLLPYPFLGETRLINYFNLTKGNFFSHLKTLPYATTPHPNVFATVIFILNLIICQEIRNLSFKTLISAKKIKTNKINNLFVFNIKFGILFIFNLITLLIISITQSMAVFLSFIIYLIISQVKFPAKLWQSSFWLISLVGFLIAPLIVWILSQSLNNNDSIMRRNSLNIQSINLFFKNPFLGVGWQNFTTFEQKFYPKHENLFFNQPVHNVFLLFLTENGLGGIIFLLLIIKKITQKKRKLLQTFLVIFCPILCLDHHFLTLNIGLFNLFLILNYFFLFNTKIINQRSLAKSNYIEPED